MATTLNFPVRPGRVIDYGEDYAVVLGPWRTKNGSSYELAGTSFELQLFGGQVRPGVVDAEAGTVTLTIPAEMIKRMPARSNHTLSMIRPDGTRRVLFKGTVLVGPA